MNDEYIKLSHKKAVFLALQRFLVENFVENAGQAKQALTADEAPYSQRIVSQKTLAEVLNILQVAEIELTKEMNQFQMVKSKPFKLEGVVTNKEE